MAVIVQSLRRCSHGTFFAVFALDQGSTRQWVNIERLDVKQTGVKQSRCFSLAARPEGRGSGYHACTARMNRPQSP
jgi:hypothetical protein